MGGLRFRFIQNFPRFFSQVQLSNLRKRAMVAFLLLGMVVAGPASATPLAPTINAEPVFTRGTANSISWDPGNGSDAVEFKPELATNSQFTANYFSPGWVQANFSTFTSLVNGRTYYYRVRGRNGSSVEGPFSNVVSSTQDDQAPQTRIHGPQQRASLDFDLTVSEDIADLSGLVSWEVFYRVNSGIWQQLGSTWTANPIHFHATGNGVYEFYSLGTDAVGNRETNTGTIADLTTVVDINTPTMTPSVTPPPTDTPPPTSTPTISATPTTSPTPTRTPAPPNAPQIYQIPAFTKGLSITLTWTGEHETGAVDYNIQLSVDNFQSVSHNSGWIPETNFTFEGLADATKHYFRVNAVNVRGEQSRYSNIVSSTQDNKAPSSRITDPINGGGVGGPVYVIKGSANDFLSGISLVEVSTDDGGTWHEATGKESWSYSWTLPGNGVYFLHSRATDNAGNLEPEGSEPRIRVIADSGVPRILLGGYWNTVLNRFGGTLTLMAFTTDGDVESIGIGYSGAPTGILLNDRGLEGDLAAGDGLYAFSTSFGSGLTQLRALLTLDITDTNGNESSWPYLTIR